jgi:hypothetical protein
MAVIDSLRVSWTHSVRIKYEESTQQSIDFNPDHRYLATYSEGHTWLGRIERVGSQSFSRISIVHW